MMRAITYLTCLTAGMLPGPGAAQSDKLASPSACHVGVYRLADGRTIDVAPEGKSLRWRMVDGSTGVLHPAAGGGWTSTLGWTVHPDGKAVDFGDCGQHRITFEGVAGRAITLETRNVSFQSGGVTLAGRLTMPAGTGQVPIMVIGHGSERTSALETAFRQRLYPAMGVGVFVFDKRGTGASGGKYTQDFDILANDVVAAVVEARQLAGKRAGRVGLQGGSQAGWVLPLAATRTKVDYVIVGYGIAASPAVEDRTETLQDLTAAGWGPDVLAKAREITDATAAIRVARFADGYAAFNAAVARYRTEPWFKDLKGEYTGEMVKYTEAQLRAGGPARDDGTPFGYDAVGTLRRLQTPLLWMVAGSDTQGPGEETPAALLALKASGKPITVVRFPNTEHGIHELRIGPNGKREEVAYAGGYFPVELDFARTGRLRRAYRGAEFLDGRR